MRHTRAEPVAVVGVGNIGAAVVAHLVETGATVSVWDPSVGALERAAEVGACVEASAADAARVAGATIVCVPSAAAVEEAVLGTAGVLSGMPSGGMIVDMGTNLPATARGLAEASAAREVDFVDAPVSGGPRRARAGELSAMVGGTREAFDRAQPLLAVLAKHVFHVGAAGSGQAMKLVNNTLTAVNLVAIGEAIALGRAEGIDLATIDEVVRVSSGDSKRFRDSVPRLMRGEVGTDYGHVDILAKDLEMALVVGSERRLPMPAATLASQMLRIVQAHGNGGRDIEAVVELYAEYAGIELPGGGDDTDNVG